MNCVVITGTVLGTTERNFEFSERYVCNFRLAVDTPSGKRPTEITISCWGDLGRFFAQYLSAGERVAVTGALGHMVRKGVVICASQIARLNQEFSANDVESSGAGTGSEPDDSELEKNWTDHLDLGNPGARK
jgi:single-stranded DNA-binding protein